jgi:MFS family permease
VKVTDPPTRSGGRAPERGGRLRERDAGLRGEEKVRLALLALPAFALALSITMVASYLGTVARRYTSHTIVIGAIVGGEGVMALWVPLIAGPWSDRLRTRLGGRLPFVIVGSGSAAVGLALVGLVGSIGLVALVAAIFYGAYFVAYEPYRAMYPDLLQREQVAGRAQSSQAVARGAGTACALLGGGLLLTVARPLPFVVAAGILVAAVALFAVLVVDREVREQVQELADGPAHVVRRLHRALREHPALRAYLIANALWETALSSLKAFVVLYLTVGLGYGLATASLIIGAVALVILVGAGFSGKLGDRFGLARVAAIAVVAYGLGFLVPGLTTNHALILVAVPFIALGGGTVMTLAYAILMPLMPEDQHGLLTGFYSVSRGLGLVAGPLLAGAAISLTADGPFASTNGFQAIWLVCGAAALASLPFIRRLRKTKVAGQANL